MKTKYVKLPPDLSDDEHWTPNCDRHEIGWAIEAWIVGHPVGSKITLEIIELTDEEVEALPSI